MTKNTRNRHRSNCIASGQSSKGHAPRAAAMMAAAIAAMLASQSAMANGPADYFDVNGVAGGFGSPSGSNYDENGAYWTTNSNGSSPTGGFPGNQLTFGATSTDLAGTNFTVNMDGNSFNGIAVNSSSANITLVGGDNAYLNGSPQTWNVAAGSVLTENQTWNGVSLNYNQAAVIFTGGGTINIVGPMAYNDGNLMTENGTGVLNLEQNVPNGASNFNFTLTNGTLNFATANSANEFNQFTGGHTLSINGGTIDNTTGSPMTLSVGTGSYSVGGSFTFTGSSSLNFGTQGVVLSTTPTITTNHSTLTLGGTVSGTGFVKAGTGTLALGGTNSYTGSTIINAGTLALTNAASSNNISTSPTINIGSAGTLDVTGLSGSSITLTGVQTLTGAGNISGSVATSAGSIITPGSSTVLGNLTISGALTTAAGSVLNFYQGTTGAGNSKLAVNGTNGLTLNGGTVNWYVLGSTTTAAIPGNYNLISYAGTLGGAATNLTAPSGAANGATYTLVDTGTGIQLDVGNAFVWSGATNSTWDTATSNWYNGTSNTAFTNGSAVTFADTTTGLPGGPTVTNNNITIAGGGVSPASVTVLNNAVNYTIASSDSTGIYGSTTGLTKAGTGTLTLTGTNTYAGGTMLAGGIVNFGSGSIGTTGNVTFTGGTLQYASGNTSDLSSRINNSNNAIRIDTNGNAVTYASALSSSNTGGLTVADSNAAPGSLTLTATAAYSGATTVNSGKLIFQNIVTPAPVPVNGVTVPTSIVINSPGTLVYNLTTSNVTQTSTTISGNGTLQLAGDGNHQVTFGGGGNVNWNLGSGALIDVEAGTMVGGSSIQDFWTNDLASLNIAGGATFRGVEANIMIDALTGAGTFKGGYPGAGYASDTIGVNNDIGGTATFSGSIQDDAAQMNLVKTGTGTQIFTGSTTYSGSTTVNGGTLTLTGAATLGATNTPLTVSNPNTGAGTGVTLNLNPSLAITVGSLSGAIATPSSGANTATINTQASELFTVKQTNGGTFAGSIAGSGSFALGAGSTATLILSGSNSYSGGTTINAATLQFAKINSMPASGTIAALSGATLAVNVGGSGEFTNATSGNGSLGALSAGTGGQGAPVTFAAGSTLGIDTTNAGGSFTFAGNINNTGLNINKFGNGTLAFTGSNSYTGVTTISGGTLSTGAAGTLANEGTGGTPSSVGASSNAAANLVLNGGTLQYANTGAAETTDRLFTIAGGTTTSALDSSGTSITFSNAGSIAFTGGANTAQTFTLTGTGVGILDPILGNHGSGVTLLNKTGAGAWTLGGVNTFGTTAATPSAASVNITGGTLNLASTSALGITGGTVNINATSMLQLLTDAAFGTSSPTSPTYNLWYGNSSTTVGPITGTIALGRNTPGAGGSLTQNFGTLTLASFGGNPVTLNVVAGANASSALDTIAFTGLLTGNGNPVTHQLIPTGGNITIGTVGTVPGTSATSTLDLDGTTTGNTITGAIGGGANVAIAKSNTSTWTFGGTSTYTGPTAVTGGTLALNSGGNLGATAITVSNGATFAVIPAVSGNTNTLAGSLTLNAGSKFSMADGVASTTSITGSAAFNGTGLTFDLGGGGTVASDTLTIGGAATVNGTNSITLSLFGTADSSLLTAAPFTLISDTSGSLGSSFSLTNNRVVIAGNSYTAALSNTGSAELVTLTFNGAAQAYYTGNASLSTLSATTTDVNSNTVTNFSTDSTGSSDLGAQPTSVQDVFFTAGIGSGTSGTQSINTSLGQNYIFASLNFTSGSPAFTFSDASGFGLTVNNGITDASANSETLNVPVTLGLAQTITNSCAGLLAFTDGVTAANLITVAGSGSVTISGTAAFNSTAGFTVNSGAGAFTVSAPVTLGGIQTWTNNSAAPVIVSGPVTNGGFTLSTAGTGNISIAAIGGAGGLTAGGTGTTTLSGTSTYTGATTVNSGATLSLNGTIGSGSGTAISSSGTFTQTISGVITAASTVSVSAGTTTLGGVNDYTGATTVTGGTLDITGSVIGSSLVKAVSGGTLTIEGTVTVANNGAFAAGSGANGTGTVIVNNGGILNIGNGAGGNVGRTYIGGQFDNNGTAGSGNLTINTGGTVNLAAGGNATSGDGNRLWMGPWGGGANTLNLNGGTMSTARSIQDGGAGNSTINFNGGVLQFTAAGLVLAPQFIVVGAGGGTIDTQGNTVTQGAGSPANAGTISGTGTLTKIGSGIFSLTASNTFNGGVNITGGELLLSGAASINSSTGITVNGLGASLVQASSVASTPAIALTQGTVSVTGAAGNITVADSAANTVAAGAGTVNLSGLTYTGAGALTLATGSNLQVGALATNGVGKTISVSNTGGWNAGTTQILGYSSYNTAANISDFTVTGLTANQSQLSLLNTGSAIDVVIAGQKSGVVTWGAAKTIAAPSDIFALGTLSYAYTEGGVAATTVNTVPFASGNSATSLGSLADVTLSGFGGTYGGYGNPTVINGTTYANLTTGGTYIDGSSGTSVTLNHLTGGHVYATEFWVNESRGIGGRADFLSSTGGNTVQLNFGGDTSHPGQYSIGGFTASGAVGAASQSQTFTMTGNGGSIQLNAIQVRDVTGVWSGATNGNWDSSNTSANLNFTGSNNFNVVSQTLGVSTVYFGDTDGFGNAITTTGPNAGNNITVGTGGVSTGTINFVNNSVPYTFNSSSDNIGIFGATILNKTGTAEVTLAGVNTFSGTITIGAGTLQIGTTAGSAASLGGGSYNGAIANSGTLEYSSTAAQTLSGNITGTGVLTKDISASVLTLSGTNTYSGVTTVNAGTLEIARETSLYNFNTTPGSWTPANITVAAGATLALNVGGSGQFSSGDLTTILDTAHMGGGTLGNTTSGFLTGSSLGLDTSAGNFLYAGVIADPTSGQSLGLTKLGANTLTITHSNTYSGGTTILNGTLQLGVANALPTGGTITFGATGANGVLDLAGFNQQVGGLAVGVGATVSNQIIGNSSTTADSTLIFNGGSATFDGVIKDVIAPGTRSVALSVTGGSLTLTGQNTYSGGTTVSQGTLSGSTGSFGSGNVTVVSTTSATVNSNASFSPNAVITIGSGGTVNFMGQTETIGTLNDNGAGSVGSVVLGNAGAGENPMATTELVVTKGGHFAGPISDQSNANPYAGGLLLVSGATPTTTLTLSGSNTYVGGTTISSGTLLANGPAVAGISSPTGTGSVTVSGGRLGGTGTIGNGTNTNNYVSINAGGTLSPGADGANTQVGTLTTGDQIWSTGGQYLWKLNGTNETSDLVVVNGTLNIAASTGNTFLLTIERLDSGSALTSGTYTIATAANVTGNFTAPTTTGASIDISSSFTIADATPGENWDVTLTDTGAAGSAQYAIDVTVPEPGSLGLLAVASLGLLRRRRKNRIAQVSG